MLQRDAIANPRYVFASSYLIYDPSLYLLMSQSAQRTRCGTDRINHATSAVPPKLLHEQEIALASQGDEAGFCVASASIVLAEPATSSRWACCCPAANRSTVGEESRFDYVYSADVADGLLRRRVRGDRCRETGIGSIPHRDRGGCGTRVALRP